MLQVKAMHVDIETCSSLSAGQTVCDVWDRSAQPKNATVALVSPLRCYHCCCGADNMYDPCMRGGAERGRGSFLGRNDWSAVAG